MEGSTAPALTPAKWLKGAPVKRFEPGQVYVVEFWATWCGPCKESIPHLTELAHRFRGKVTFIGVNVWDRDTDPKSTAYVNRVARWVDRKGREMDYNVCVDDLGDTVANTWLKAAGQNGIPATFVVDQDGKIAWIGHPMVGLDRVLDMVTEGTYTPEAAQALRDEQSAKQKETQGLVTSAQELMKAGQTDEAFAKLDALVAKEPSYKSFLPVMKFQMLAEADEAKGLALAKKYVDEATKDTLETVEAVGMYIAMGYVPLKQPDYDLAIRALTIVKDANGNKTAPGTLMALAEAHFKKGDKAAAIKWMGSACKAAENDPDSTPKPVEFMKKKLAEYKRG